MKDYHPEINFYAKKDDVADFKHFLAFCKTMPLLFSPCAWFQGVWLDFAANCILSNKNVFKSILYLLFVQVDSSYQYRFRVYTSWNKISIFRQFFFKTCIVLKFCRDKGPEWSNKTCKFGDFLLYLA